MDKMMSYCGLMCSDCDAYKATVNNDDMLRKQTAENWSKAYGYDIKAEEINCLGCKSDVNFVNCAMCKVRACNIEKKLNRCVECDSFVCDMLDEMLNDAFELKQIQDLINSN